MDHVVKELNGLVLHKKHGFPGLRLSANGPIETHVVGERSSAPLRTAGSDAAGEAWFSRLEGVKEDLLSHLKGFEDHMNVKLEELSRNSDNVAGAGGDNYWYDRLVLPLRVFHHHH